MSATLLCSLGHIATARTLGALGVSRRELTSGVADGRVLRVRRGTYCCTHLDQITITAVATGGALSCVSILRDASVWAGHSQLIHVQVPPKASERYDPGVLLHWERPRFPMETPWRAGRMQALWQAIRCLDQENAIAAMESALHEKYLTLDEVHRIRAMAPERLRREQVIENSGSGNETIVRLRLRDAGHIVEAQSFVPGMGHGDLLVDGCIGVDVDGRHWHGEDRFAIDRDRDIHSEGLGRHVLRLRVGHIFDSWPHTLTVIERAVEDARRANAYRASPPTIRSDDPY